MRTRLTLIAILACAIPHGWSRAQDKSTPKTPTFEGWDNRDLFDYGTSLLRKGRTLNRAIASLEILVKRDPVNSLYQQALACAYASRFASVSLARQQLQRYPDDVKGYERNKEWWEKGQDDPTDRLYQKPGPTPPPTPATPDDDVTFTMTADESRREMLRLGHLAVDWFAASCKLSESVDKEQKLQAIYAKGWGLFLLRRFGRDIISDPEVPATSDNKEKSLAAPLVVTEEEVAACFRKCTAEDADKSDFWHSLALAIVPKYLNFDIEGIGPYLNGESFYEEATLAAATDALERALKRKRNDFGLLYLMSVLYAPTKPDESIRYLDRAIHLSSDNAVAWYQLAERKFRRMEKVTGQEEIRLRDEALAAIETGNAMPHYKAIPLSLPAPTLLRKAWDSAGIHGIGDAHLVVNGICNSLRDFIRGDKATDPDLAARAAVAEFGFGLKIMQGMGGEDLDTRNVQMRLTLKIRRLFGPVWVVDGYQQIDKLNQKHHDPEKARFLKENAEIARRAREIDRATYY